MTPTITTIDLDSADWGRFVRRNAAPDPDVVRRAAAIVADVAQHGDEALARYADRFGGALSGGRVRVPDELISGAADRLPPALRTALETAIENIATVHERQRPRPDVVEPVAGVTVERVWTPVSAVGVYVPGGRAAYPSSLLMGVVPARIAGVPGIAVATPAAPDGTVDPTVLATADLLGIDRLYAMGGAQAVGALAYGTESVAPVDTIVGPGGPWVTAAKLAVMGVCGIDVPAGPSEAVVVADESADPRVVAADVMCQAEHGEESAVVLVTTRASLAEAVVGEITTALDELERRDIITSALADHGLVAIASDIEQACAFANAWAPEHLSVHTDSPRTHADRIPNAGSVFVGHWTPEAAGDYATGANHVLPTGGLARAYGPLSVDDFGSWRQIQTASRSGLAELAPTVMAIAEAEGFTAHARTVRVRLEDRP